MRAGLVAVSLAAFAVAGCGAGTEPPARLPSGDHVHSLAVTAEEDLLLGLHGGLYRSSDGKVWNAVGLQREDAMVIAAAVGQPMFVAGHEVLYRSGDGGETFTPLRPADLPGLDLHAFAQVPTDGGSVYAYAVGHGLFWSGDAGNTWEERAGMGQLPRDLFGLAVPGASPDSLVAVGPESGILRSADGGRTWAQAAEISAWAVTVEVNNPRVVWALTGAGLMRSPDRGETWETVSELAGVEGQPVALAVESDVLWVVTEEPRILYRSSDGGKVWDRVAGS